MRRHRLYGEATGFLGRLVVAFTLLVLVFTANADDCFSLYAKSGATPGSRTCKLDVTSNTPGGMGNYACINDLALIDQWCSSTETPPDDTCPVADPVFPANGVVTLSETDFASGDTSPLVFSRSYFSKPFDKTQTAMGGYWVSNWQRRLDLTAANASTPKISAYRSNGQPLIFKWVNGAWAVPGTSGLALTKAGDGYFHLKDERIGTTETYSVSTGLFHSETTRTGMYREVQYVGQRIDSIVQWPVDRIGQNASRLTLSLAYDGSGRILSVVPPSGNATHYAYDAKGNLASVTAPIGYVRQYLYEDVRFPNALTGIKDESGSRIATWTYDSSGRAISVTHPDTTRNVSLRYGSGTTTVGNLAGNSTYSFSVGDTSRPGSIATPGGTVSRTWDTSGNLKQRVTPDGNTQYTWDGANRPTKAVATVAGSKTVTTVEYSDSSSLRPHLVAMPSKIRAFVYDTEGHVTGYAEWQTTDPTGEQGMQAVAAGDQMTVGARYDQAGRLLSATVVRNGVKTEDWTYTYDARGNIATTRDAVSGWAMRTLGRDAENRATQIAGNSGQASIGYDERGRVKSFQYNEPASSLNGGLARVLAVDYQYAANGSVSSHSAKVSTNGAWWQPISDAELGMWLTNWELGNDPVAPSASLTGLQSDTRAFVPGICVECYMRWKATLTEKLFESELSAALPAWGEATEVMLSDQAQVPYPVLVPDLTSSAKRAMLYSTLFGAGSGDGGMVKCGSSGDNEWREADCHAKYESDMFRCNSLAKYMGGLAGLALCKKNAFDDYQECRGH
jgi:YD repeat-containing protein